MHRPMLRCWTLALALAALAASTSSSAAQEGPYPPTLRPYVSQLTAQLRAYVVAEEQFYAEHERYGTLGAPEAESEIDLTLGPGVRWVAQAEFGTRGHYLLLSHDEALELACAVVVGDVGSRTQSPLGDVLGEDAAEGAPGCRVFETVKVCPSGHAYPGIVNWNFCPYDGGRLRDSVPNTSPVEWNREHAESDRADIATLAVGGGTVEVTAFHNKLVPDSLASEANRLQLRVTRGDSLINLLLDAYRVPDLLEDLGRGAQAVVAIADELLPTSLTVRLGGKGNTLAFTCAGETGCRPAGPFVLVLSLTQQDVRDLFRALETGLAAFDAYGGVVPPGARRIGTLSVRVRPVSDVLVDGLLVERMTTSARVDLPPGLHRVTLRSDGFVTKDTVVRVLAGDTTLVRTTIRRQEP